MRLIWAEDLSGGIGANNELLWHIPEDLKRFKALTSGSEIVMGYNTWVSLPTKPLPGRTNIVLSRSRTIEDMPGVSDVVRTAEEVLALYPNAWVIGGASVYELFMPHATEVYRTVISQVFSEADTFAPKGWEHESFVKVSDELHVDKNGTKTNFEVWKKA